MLFVAVVGLCFTTQLPAQEPGQTTAPPSSAQPQEKRLFGIIPNYRTAPIPTPYQPLSVS